MGVDVASFGDFFADMRPANAQLRTVSQIARIANTSDANPKETDRITESKALPAIQISVDEPKNTLRSDSTFSKTASSKRKSQRKDDPLNSLVYKDPFGSTYKKYIFTADGKYLLGGMMIGDVADYVKLVAIVKKKVL